MFDNWGLLLMNYVSITTSYQDGRNIVYVSSIGLGKTMAEAEDNCEKTLFKYHPQVKPYYRGIQSCQSHQSNYDFKLEDAFTELRGLDKNPELMQILLDYLPEAITRELPGIKVVSDVTTKTTPNGFVVSVDLQDRDGNEFTLDVGYGSKVGVHVSIFSDKDNRYVSDTAKGYPPQCPDIKELLNQYYKHINRARQNKEESMNKFKCSMQKKTESLSKKSEASIDDLKGMVVSEGTMGVNVLIRKYLDVLETYAPDNYKVYIEANPELKDRNVWMALDVRDKSYIVDELADELDKIAPEGYYFGASEGDGACYGFWEVESDESKKCEADKDAVDWTVGVSYLENGTGESVKDVYLIQAPNMDSAMEQAKIRANKVGKDATVYSCKKGKHVYGESKKSEGVSGTIKMNIDYNTFMRLLDAAAYLDADDDYKDALWDYYSEFGEIDGNAFEFFDNLFQYTAWYDVDEMYDAIGERFQDESKSKEECIQDAIDDVDMTICPYNDHYLVIF